MTDPQIAAGAVAVGLAAALYWNRWRKPEEAAEEPEEAPEVDPFEEEARERRFSKLLVSLPSDGTRRWELHEPMYYLSRDGVMYKVPNGFITDLASVPRFLWPIIPPFGHWSKPAVLHDYLYNSNSPHKPSRAEADKLFREAVIDCNGHGITAWVLWAGVRIGGWLGYRKVERAIYE